MGMLHTPEEATAAVAAMAEAFARIDNPPGVFPAQELVPLGPVWRALDGGPAALFLDMDGTITCTEPLFLHGVEAVVRRATGWRSKGDWSGLDPERDHPKIVGFNTQRNLEYLHGLHGGHLNPGHFFDAFDEALVFLCEHDVPGKVRARIKALLDEYNLGVWWTYANAPRRDPRSGHAIKEVCTARFSTIDLAMFSQFGLAIFYADYLDALEKVNRGEGATVSEMLFGDATIPAVAPMPGIALICALAKGWLPHSAAAELARVHGRNSVGGHHLAGLCRRFTAHPVPLALVTSSGAHETGLVMEAVFRAMRGEVAGWPLDAESRDRILAGFAGPHSCFDALVTCDDVPDGRTKPYRDPYTLALQRLGLDGAAARRVIGFEDTEAGIIAQRGAGVGIPCAVPIEFTLGQDFSAAARVLPGGVPEAIFEHGLFLE